MSVKQVKARSQKASETRVRKAGQALTCIFFKDYSGPSEERQSQAEASNSGCSGCYCGGVVVVVVNVKEAHWLVDELGCNQGRYRTTATFFISNSAHGTGGYL